MWMHTRRRVRERSFKLLWVSAFVPLTKEIPSAGRGDVALDDMELSTGKSNARAGYGKTAVKGTIHRCQASHEVSGILVPSLRLARLARPRRRGPGFISPPAGGWGARS